LVGSQSRSFYKLEKKNMSYPCKDSQNFYKSGRRLSNPRSRFYGRSIQKVVSYLSYVFGEDGYLNFDSLDYNALYFRTFYVPYGENFISVPSNKVLSSKTSSFYSFYLPQVFSPWAGQGRDQSSVRRLVWLWYAASWANS
jgi:hypothetical protein